MGKVKYPGAFQGSLRKKFYFEGWYNKIVDKNGKNIFAFIPAIALNTKLNTSHAFIQILDGIRSKPYYFKFPIEDFKNLSKTNYDIRLGNNYFSDRLMRLNINKNGNQIKGIVKYRELIPWPKSFLQPGIMGPFSYLPFLETYHGLVSMNHSLEGVIKWNGKSLVFNGGKGYIEKDWGKSFPSAWIWTQSNHFSYSNTSFMFSIASISFMNKRFIGFLTALWHDNVFYKFATYTGAKVKKLEFHQNNVSVVLSDKKYLLNFKLMKKNISKGQLISPHKGVMSGRIAESINSQIRIKLFNMQTRELILKDTGFNAGLEVKNPKQLI